MKEGHTMKTVAAGLLGCLIGMPLGYRLGVWLVHLKRDYQLAASLRRAKVHGWL